MDNNNMVGIENYANLLRQIGALFNLSLPEIKSKYEDYPHCLLDYFEKESTEKAIEIRFDNEGITIICFFDSERKCDFIYLFTDHDEAIEAFIAYFKETFDYNYIKNRWTALNYFIIVKETSRLPNEMCLAFYC